jgi:hypothetical protein
MRDNGPAAMPKRRRQSRSRRSSPLTEMELPFGRFCATSRCNGHAGVAEGGGQQDWALASAFTACGV